MLRLGALSRSFLQPRTPAALVLVAASPARAWTGDDALSATSVRVAAALVVDFRPTDDGTPPAAPGDRWTVRPTNIEYASYFDQGASWKRDAADEEVLEHEPGHLDLAELEAQRPNRDKKSAIDHPGLVGTGDDREQAMRDFSDKLKKHIEKVSEKVDAERKSPAPAGTRVESKSSHSVHYDAAAKRLSFTDDVFTHLLDAHGLPLLADDDALLGAELVRLRITPDQDLAAATQDFTVSGTSSFTNGVGAATSTPESPSAGLMGAGLALLAGWLGRARRRDRSVR
jgi:hypothetical protein